jgi:pyridoxine kinase
MARIVAISSQVASGHVGLSAIVPALQALGHDVIALPTVLLSNHPGRQATFGTRIAPDVVAAMFATLAGNGRLEGVDAVLSGYLPSAEHVRVVANCVRQLRAASPALVYLCDPVLGDDPKGLYIDPAAATAIRVELLPLADIVTPNRFELSWLLSGRPVDGPDTAIAAARLLARPLCVATSIPLDLERLATLAISLDRTDQAAVGRRSEVPNGSGDLLSALFLAGYLAAEPDAYARAAAPLTWAVSEIDRILNASVGQAEMALIPNLRSLVLQRSTP